MASDTHIEIDRARIKELTEREAARLDERTQGSREFYARAQRSLVGGVASSYQSRDPWPIYLSRGKGAQVWDVDGNEYLDFHNGFGSMVQGHAHPTITRAVNERIELGTHFAAPTEDAIVVGEELARRWGLPKWRYVNSGSEATMDAIRIARAATGRDTIVKIFGSYHGHHDYVMVSIGVEYDKIGDRFDLESLPVRARDPAGRVGHDDRRAVQRRRGDGAADRAARRGGPRACLRDHGAGDDEPRGRAARARLPRGSARDHAQARRAADLRRGQDGALHRGRRRGRAVRRHARSRHAGEGARRRAALRRDRRHGEAFELVEARQGRAGRHLQRQPALDGGGPRQPARGDDARRVRPPRRAQRAPARGLPDGDREVLVPGLLGRHRLEGLRHVLAARRSPTTRRSRRTRTPSSASSRGSTT